MEIAKQFGIEPVLLLAQIVNFLIILFVLKKFFYKPIVKVLEDRKKKIEESLKNADFIEEKLNKTEEKTAKALEEARKNAQLIIAEANKEAQRINKEAHEEARKTLEQTIERAKVQIENQKKEMQSQLEKETLTLVVDVVKRVLGKNLNTKEKQSLTSKAIGEIERQTH